MSTSEEDDDRTTTGMLVRFDRSSLQESTKVMLIRPLHTLLGYIT
jgi:hypothetical protein